MTSINLDHIDTEYSDSKIFLVVNTIRHPNYTYISDTGLQLNPLGRLMLTADLMEKVHSLDLLMLIVRLSNNDGFLGNSIEKHEKFINALPIENAYTPENYLKISASYFSVQLHYEILSRHYSSLFKFGFPELSITVSGKTLTHNIDEVSDAVKRTSINYAVDYASDKSKLEQENHLKKLITGFTRMDYQNGTDSFNREIEYLKTLKENLTDNSLPQPKDKTLWFTVGLQFANGNIQRLYKESHSGSEIATHLGNKSYRPYITDTLGNQRTSDKNIYSSFKKMKTINDYCIKNNISICDDFKDAYGKIQPL